MLLNLLTRHIFNKQYFPGRRLSTAIVATELKSSLEGRRAIFLAAPSHAVETVFGNCMPYTDDISLVVNHAKGLSSNGRLIYSALPVAHRTSLKGPTFAIELFNGLPLR